MAKFNIISQFLKDISFESPNVPELFFKNDNGQAKLEINIDIQIKGAENNLFMVDLIVKVHSKLENGDKSIFLIDSTYSGLVQMEEEKDEEVDTQQQEEENVVVVEEEPAEVPEEEKEEKEEKDEQESQDGKDHENSTTQSLGPTQPEVLDE